MGTANDFERDRTMLHAGRRNLGFLCHIGRPRVAKAGLSASAATLGIVVALAAHLVPAAAKDIGPVDKTCDAYAKTTAAWRTCAAAARVEGSDAQLFYAGYWLAKNGHYREALDTLARVSVADSATLTYRGFATRKIGRTEEALGHYAEALRLDPANAVTRSYLGEAYLSLGRIDEARAELDRIDAICGRECGAYRELAAAFATTGVPL